MKKFNTLLVAIIAVGLVGVALVAGVALEKNQNRNEADRAFIEMMIPHHQSAIEMAQLADGRAKNPEIQALTVNVIRDQEREIAQMREWYKDWYGKEVPQTDGHGSGGHNSMQGMSDSMMAGDLEKLRNASNFDLEFVQQMIPHHEGAVKMAQNILLKAKHEEIKDLANMIIASQSKEIQEMRELEVKFMADQ